MSKLLSVICLLPGLVFAGQCQLLFGGVENGVEYNGPSACKQAIVHDLKVNGPLTMVNSIQTGKLVINGPLTAENSQLAEVVINGPLTAKNVIIKEQLTISSNYFSLENSKTKNILVLKMQGSQRVKLKNSIVDGNLIFKSGKGKLLMDKTSKITGKVEGLAKAPHH
jgi:hypothetical protein